jgi:hypothetical protein
MVPTVVGTEATRKGGEACDFVIIAVDEGREDVWEDAARMWATSRYRITGVKVRGPGRIAVLVPRRSPLQQVNAELVLEGIGQQFRLNTTNPNPAARPRSVRS